VRNRFVPLLLFLLITFVLIVLMEDFVQRMIIAPMLSVVWFLAVVVASLPQLLFWGIFILAALIIATKSIGREKTFRSQNQGAPTSQRGPVAVWLSLLERAKSQDFSRWRLAQSIRKLTLNIQSPNGPLDQLRGEESKKGADLNLPPEIEAYFGAPMPSYQRFRRFWGQRGSGSRSAALDLDPEKVIEFLENELNPLLGDNR
jgi:hypothetical protein